MKILLYHIYGDQRNYHLELSYSVLSAYRFLRDDPRGVRIVLVADEQNKRPDLPVENIVVSAETLDEWSLDWSYHHAIKPCAVQHVMQLYQAPVISLDTDTFFLAHPAELFDRIAPGNGLMHVSEGSLRESVSWAEWQALIEKSDGEIGRWSITPETVMHNSGAFGLSVEDAGILDAAKELIASIRTMSDMFTTEQLAISMVLSEKMTVSHCPDIVDHYWHGPRAYFHYQMNKFFPEVRSGGGVEDPDMVLPALETVLPKTLKSRIAAKLKRMQRGADDQYGYAYLAYLSALSCRQSDQELANVWASTALDTLVWGMQGARVNAAQDFVAFAGTALDTQSWMSPKLRERWAAYW